MSNLNFLNILEMLGLISFDESIRVSANAFVQVVEEGNITFKPLLTAFPELTEELPQAVSHFQEKAEQLRHKLRFVLSLHNGYYSAETFDSTKAVLRIDLDVPLKKDQVFEYVERLPIRPNVVSSTVKGWHIFYITSESITKDETHFKDLLEEFKYLIKATYSVFKGNKVLDNVQILYQIMTRYSNEIYLLREPYTKEELFAELISLQNEEEVKLNGDSVRVKTNLIPISSLNANTFQTIIDACPIMKALEEKWESHNYHEWFLMAWKYAVFAHLTGDYSTYAREFVKKSMLYADHPKGDKIQKTFDYVYKWGLSGGGLKYFSCQWLHHHTTLSDKCKSCKIAKWKDGALTSSFIRDMLTIRIQGFELDERSGFWCCYTEDGKMVPVAEYFLIEDFIYLHKPEVQINLLKVLTNKGLFWIPLDITTGAQIDYSSFSPITFDPLRKKEFKQLIEKYLSMYINKHGRRILNQIGYIYDKERTGWRYIIAGKDNFKTEDLSFFMYGVMEKDTRRYMPSVKGSFDIWSEIYREIYKDKDPAMLLILGYFLTHIINPYLQETSLREELNTLVFLRGSSGTGKTTRLRIASALFGVPATIDISETTITRIEREFGNYKIPLPLDEVRANTDEKKRQVENLIYLIANEGAKATSYAVYEPIKTPVIIAGEPQNLPIEDMLAQNEGLFRRSLVLLLDDEKLKPYEDLLPKYNQFIRKLFNNHGHIFKFCEVLDINRKSIEELAERLNDVKILQQYLTSKGFKDAKVKLLSPIDNLLNRIMLCLKLLGEFLNIEQEEINSALNNLLKYITESMSSFYEIFLPREKNIEEELYDFILEFTDRLFKIQQDDKNLSMLKTIKGKSLESLLKIAKIRTPSTKTLKLTKLILLKNYKYNFNSHFKLTKTVLIDRLLTDKEIQEDAERVVENISKLSKEDAELCLKVYARTARAVISDRAFEVLAKAFNKFGIDIWKYVEDRQTPPPTPPFDPNDNPDNNGPTSPLTDNPNGSSSFTSPANDEEDLDDLTEHFINGSGSVIAVKQQAKVVPMLVKDVSSIPAKYNEPVYVDIEAEPTTQKPVLLAIYQNSYKDKIYLLDLRKTNINQVKEWLLRFDTISGWALNYDLVRLGFTYEELKDKRIEDIQILVKYAFFERFKNHREFGLDKCIQDILGEDYTFNKKAMQMSFGSLLFTQEQLLYNALDVYYLPKLKEKAIEKKAPDVVVELDYEALKVCVDTSQLGMPFKQDEAKAKLSEITKTLREISEQLPFNPLSPPQTASYLKLQDTKEETLRYLILSNSEAKDIAEKVLLARKLNKEKSMIENYLRCGDRVYGMFWTTTAPSGRMSCIDENLQQVPRNLRHLFGFKEGDPRYLIIADFPQIELRLAGALWREPKFVEAFREGKDLHKLTASIIYNKPIEEVKKEERQIAKSANFGLIYGASVRGFVQYCIGNGINISEQEASKIITNFFNFYTKIREQHELVRNYFKVKTEFIGDTWLGREYLATSPNEALNYQIQGSGAELFKRAITELKRKHPSLRIVNLVHDEIVVECEHDCEDVARVVKEEMEQAWSWCVEQAKTSGRLVEEFDLRVEDVKISKAWIKD